MSVITFQCYACNQVLQVGADKAGRRAKCSGCGTILTIPALAPQAAAPPVDVPQLAPPLPPPAPPMPRMEAPIDDVEVVHEGPPPARGRRDDFDDGPPRRRRRENDYDDYDVRKPQASKWDKPKIGTLLVFIGMCVLAGVYGLQLLGMLILQVGGIGIGRVIQNISVTISFLAIAAMIVGHVFWLFVSNRRSAFGFAIAALAVGGVHALLHIVFMVEVFSFSFSGGRFAGFLNGLVQAAHFMMIAFYLRALAQTVSDRIQSRGLERSSLTNVILSGALAGFELLGGIVLMAMAPSIVFEGGRGFAITAIIFFWLGAILTVVVMVFAILAVYQGKRILDTLAYQEDLDRG